MKKYLIIILSVFSLTAILSLRVFASGANIWQNETTISGAAYDQKNPVIVTDDSDGAIVFWEYYRENQNISGWLYAQKLTSSGTAVWAQNGLQVSTSSHIEITSYLKAIPDGSGGAIIAWQDYRNGNYDIYCQRINSNGQILWGNGDVAVISKSGSQENPAVCGDGSGGVVIVWEDSSGTNAKIVAQRISSAGSKIWTSTGVVVCTSTKEMTSPKVAYDGLTASVFIVWDELRTVGNDEDVFIQKIKLSSGTICWTASGANVSVKTKEQRWPDVVSDGSKGAIVVWWDETWGNNGYSPYAQRISSSGVTRWTSGGENISNDPLLRSGAGDYTSFAITKDTGAADKVFIVWTDQRNEHLSETNVDLYMQYFGGNPFTRYWSPASGISVSTNANNQIDPQIITTADNKAIVSWYDTSDKSIRAQKLDSTGRKWSDTYGVKVTTTEVSSGIKPTMLSDGYSGAFVSWWDDKGDDDILAQRVGDGDAIPPSAINSLTALVGTTPDELKLSWLAPGDDGTVGTAASYQVKYSTYSAYTGGWSTATWWNRANVYTQSWTPKVYNSSDIASMYLTGRTTYFVIMRAMDDAGNWSSLSNQTSSYARIDNIPPPPINDLQADRNNLTEGQLRLSWVSPYDNYTSSTGVAAFYEIRYSTNNTFPWSPVNGWVYVWASSRTVTSPAGSAETEIITGLEAKTSYYFRIRARDEVPNTSSVPDSTGTWAQMDITPPGAINTLTALASATTGWLRLSWQSPGDDGYTKNMSSCTFYVRYSSKTSITSEVVWSGPSLYSLNLSSYNVIVSTLIVRNITSLLNDTTYWFNVKTKDESNNVSNLAVPDAHAKTSDIVAPSNVTNLLAGPGSREAQILLTWTAPGDNGTVGNIRGGKYRLQYSADGGTAWNKNNYNIQWTTSTAPRRSQRYSINFSSSVEFGTTYYFRLWVTDETGILWTGLSNGATAYTSFGIYPSTVSNLTAHTLTGLGNQGAINLTWTAPGDDGIIGTASTYIIKYSTKNFNYTSWNMPWVHSVTGLASGSPPAPHVYGTTENKLISGLVNETTYWFVLEAIDDRGNATFSNTAYGITIDTVPPSAVIGLSVLAPLKENTIRLAWTAPGDNRLAGAIRNGAYWFKTALGTTTTSWDAIADTAPYPSNIYFPISYLLPGATQQKVLTGLQTLEDYTIFCKIRDERSSGVFPYWSAASVKLSTTTVVDTVPPGVITDLSTRSTNYGTVELSWTAPGDNGFEDNFGSGSKYQIRYSSWGMISDTTDFNSANPVPSASVYLVSGSTVPFYALYGEKIVISGLTDYVSYYFAVRTLDEKGNKLGVSTTAVVIPPDSTPPVISDYTLLSRIEQLGNWVVIKATATDNLCGITGVTLYSRKSSTGAYSAYNMYSGSASTEPYINYGKIETSTPVPVIQYYIRVLDRCLNEVLSTGESVRYGEAGYGQAPSAPHEVTVSTFACSSIGAGGGTLSVEDGNSMDGKSRLIIPPNALNNTTVISMYPLSFADMTTEQLAGAQKEERIKTKVPVSFMRINPDGLVLLKSATFYILYPNNDNNNLVDNTSVLETDLKVFSWDGYDWKLMSSIVYPHTENEIMLRNTVKTNVHHFSDYALFEADVTKLSLDDPRPREKIITPNGDGINDYAEFNGLTGNYEVNIYDINGKRIHRITSSAAGNNPLWRGTDTQGETVNTGVYIYQIKNLDAPTAAVLSGVIVVAK